MAGRGTILVFRRAEEHMERVFLGAAAVRILKEGRLETGPSDGVPEEIQQTECRFQEAAVYRCLL